MKYSKKFLLIIWTVGKLCGMYLLVLTLAMLGSITGGLFNVLGTLATALCCAVGGIALMCLGQTAKRMLREGRAK